MVNNSSAYKGAVYQPTKKAMEITGLSEYYFKKHLKKGDIPAIRSGNKWFINIPRLLAELEKMEKPDTSLVKL